MKNKTNEYLLDLEGELIEYAVELTSDSTFAHFIECEEKGINIYNTSEYKQRDKEIKMIDKLIDLITEYLKEEGC